MKAEGITIHFSHVNDDPMSTFAMCKKLDTKSGYSNFDTIEKADAKEKTEFWPKFCLFLCVRLLYSIKMRCVNADRQCESNRNKSLR